MGPRTCTLLLRLLQPLALARAVHRRLGPGPRAVKRRRVAFYREVWGEAATRLGATCEPWGPRAVEVHRAGRRALLAESDTSLDGPGSQSVAGDKPRVHRLLAGAGLPVPRHVAFRAGDPRPALAFLAAAGGPCVVKPACGTGAGRGVTAGIRSTADLARAAAAASVYGESLLIEELVAGDNYRLLFLDGRLLDAVLRRPPAVVGDGRSTVRRLVRRANAERLTGGHRLAQALLTIDLDMRLALAAQGLTLAAVPAAGEVVRVKTAVNENARPDNLDAADRLGAAVIEAGRRAADAAGVCLAGVDVIAVDPAVPLERSGGVILEVNTTPGLFYHYRDRGPATPVAVPILDRILDGAPEQADPTSSPTPVASAADHSR